MNEESSPLTNTAQEAETFQLSSNPRVEIEVNFLLDLYNVAPASSAVRVKILDKIRAIATAKVKAHWARGIVEQRDGTLVFDRGLYEAAVWRGKQDTYAESAEQAFKQLHSAVGFVSHFQQSEDAAAKALSSRTLEGVPLVPFAQPSITAAKLKQHAVALARLVEQMEEGLAGGLVQPAIAHKEDGGDTR